MRWRNLLLAALILPGPSLRAQERGCPASAVFLALEGEVRGYTLRANGPVAPCQVLAGPDTLLSTARSIAFSRDGALHVAQFLSNGQVNVFSPSANGNLAPLRTVFTLANDLVSIAVDSQGNDFVFSPRQGEIVFLPTGTVGTPAPRIALDAAGVTSVAIDRDDNLLVAGWDQANEAFINTLGTSQSKSSPPVLRSIRGSATGLVEGTSGWGGQVNLSIAVDPVSRELYVYNASADASTVQISVFSAAATGNVAPVRTIGGPATGITAPGILGTSKIAVSSDGRLFVAEPNNRIRVFAPGADGNVAPSQIIADATPGSAQSAQGGIAVRSCDCETRAPLRRRRLQ